MKNKLPYKTFNLFESYNADIPFTERLYTWVISVGRYIVIGTEMIVLVAFISRFVSDQILNDLTEKVNDNNKTIVRFKDDEAKYRGIMEKTLDAKNLEDTYKTSLLDEMPKVYSLAPANVSIKNVEYADTLVETFLNESLTIILTAPTDVAPKYQALLEQNILNKDQKVPNPNITIKLLNVTNNVKDVSQYNFTFKISKVG